MDQRRSIDRRQAVAIGLDRRHLLAGTAALAAGAAFSFGRNARAFTLEQADEKSKALYGSACTTNADHRQLISDASAALAARQAERLRAFDINPQGVVCPICGCRVALTSADPLATFPLK